ncbi:MAG TPA: hypothetical protein VFF73_12960 [Planctomycetota bacterium]|nr:hypothetical protein [Planctomycetota bacterium]
MDDVRGVYAAEEDRSIRERLVLILDHADPENVIERRGVIPRP